MRVFDIFEGSKHKCTCHPGDPDPDCPQHGLEPMDVGDALDEDWKKVNRRDKTDGMSRKAVNAYRRENPGSKLQTAVTTKPSKLKKGSKSAKRRKSFCARMKGMKKAHAGAKTKRNPDSPINKALRRWNCESIEEMRNLIQYAEQVIAEEKQRLDAKCWTGYKKQGTKMKGGTRVNNCVPVEEENKGLYYNVNKRKKAGISRDKDHPKAPTAQAWKDAAKTAKKEGVDEGLGYSQDPEQARWYHRGRKAAQMRDGYVGDDIRDIAKRYGCPAEWLGAFRAGWQDQEGWGKLKAIEAVDLDRSKNAQYPNDPATQKHRLDTAKRLLSDPRTDPDSRREAAAIIARMEPKGKA